MDSDEKKFSLDELPDEGSSSISEVKKPSPSRPKPEENPRKNLLKNKDADKKVRIMEQSWRFDKPEPLFGWIIYCGLLISAQILAQNPEVLGEWVKFQSLVMGIGSSLGQFIFNPIVFIVLTPLLFKFRKESDCYFEVNFDGLSTVRNVTLEKGEFHTRLLIKWAEIESIQKVTIRSRVILQLESKSGKIGQVIWDIDDHKKKGFELLLKGLIPVNHPLRKFLEKDLA